jgi:glyoxalase family protein
MRLDGIHHITATTGDAPANVDFYTRVLGLRMIAKTVNQDDPTVYHLFYGDEGARPGAELTFFEYPGAAPGRPGAGMVHRVVWRVGSPAAIGFWARRLAAEGLDSERGTGGSLLFCDREGLGHELVVDASGDPPLVAEHPEIAPELALRGFEGVRAYSGDPAASAAMLQQLMGAVPRDGRDDGWSLRGERRSGWIAFDRSPAARGRQSAGVVHHVAFGTTDAELPAWIERISGAGVPNSGYVDRHYFHSLYLREPGGVLYELATIEPGFTVDGPVAELGTKLVLPPFLESRREQIAARLTPLPNPRAGVTGARARQPIQVTIRLLGPDDAQSVLAAGFLFDSAPGADATRLFLIEPRHHLLFAYDDGGRPVGFVSGVELTHPDKGSEMFLYELGVDLPVRRRGIGRALVESLAALARERGCYGMYTLADDDNGPARTAYVSAGGRETSRPVMIEWDLDAGASGGD